MEDFSQHATVGPLIEAVDRAAIEVRKAQAGPQGLILTQKKDHDLLDVVTQADAISENVMAEVLRNSFPNIWIAGEETGQDQSKKGSLVARLDGIDGSDYFGRGIKGLWGIVACLEEDGQVISVALNFPSVNELLIASFDIGIALRDDYTWRQLEFKPRWPTLIDSDENWNGDCKIATWRGSAPKGHNPYTVPPLRNLILYNRNQPNLICSSALMRHWAVGMYDGVMIPYQYYHDLAPMRLIIPLLGGTFKFYDSEAGWNSQPITSSVDIVDSKRTFHTIGAITSDFFAELKLL